MRKAVKMWPEIILLDGTYKLTIFGLTVMFIVIENSDGESIVVGVALVITEDRETFEWFLSCFKKENEEGLRGNRCFMADKDLLQREVLNKVFPNKPVYICRFHALQIFRREMKTEEMGITKDEKEEILGILQDIAYCKSQLDYDELYAKFCLVAPEKPRKYYNDNWDPIKEEWVYHFMKEGNLMNDTNNRLEGLNSSVKRVKICAFLKRIHVY